MGWKINWWAKLQDGNHAELIKKINYTFKRKR
jgi:hypothetical protein